MENSANEARLIALANIGETAISLYLQEGKNSYQRWLRSIMKRQHFHAALVDQHGENILNRPLPPELRRLAKQVRKKQKSSSSIRPPFLLSISPLLTKEGTYYWLAATRMPPGEMQKNQRTLLLLRALIMLCLLILISWWLTRMFTRPIRELQQQTEQLGSGNLSARTDNKLARRKDELGELAYSFNTMAAQLQSLIHSHKQLLRDISHELRSPLARLQVALELARNKTGDVAASELNRIDKEALQLNELIEEVLTLARFEQGGIRKNNSMLALHKLISHIAADADFEAKTMGKTVSFNTLQSCSIYADQLWLTRAFDNVIRNALRHCSHNVEISLTCDNKSAFINICDDGDGVDNAILAQLFEPFFRASDARERPKQSLHSGYGLGLAITKRAIDLHKGHIYAKNISGGGLQISISLPLIKHAEGSESLALS